MMLVHKNEDQVKRLIRHLSKDFDIYVHIDKRVPIKIQNEKNVFVYKKYKAYWGSFNQIMATLYLLGEAYKKQYDRYLLISGEDLPIKSSEEIIKFFERDQNEYITIEKLPTGKHLNAGLNRVTRYWRNKRCSGEKNIIFSIFRRIEITLFCFINIIRTRPVDYEFYGGVNWFNLTGNCVKSIFEYIGRDKKYIQRFRWTRCGDEIFYQTIIHKIANLNVIDNCLRYIDRTNGGAHPKTLREEDYGKIINSDSLFARKFDINVDNNIIEAVYKRIHGIENEGRNKKGTAVKYSKTVYA
ncbi:MAG TPA: beta-1,6-N-acetylglucosaminyltransferase [Chitinophagaceae bacterium]